MGPTGAPDRPGILSVLHGRRMAEGAALLVDHNRQWVLSFEGRAAVRVGYDQVFGMMLKRCHVLRLRATPPEQFEKIRDRQL